MHALSRVNQISEELDRLSRTRRVTILWACESGSRAWGFESADSDYDVRFIYVCRTEDYLRVSPLRDVIELPLADDLDLSGWDLQKALGLLRKSNPPLLEWLQSPIVYQETPGFRDSFADLARQYFSVRASMYHYMNMVRKNVLESDSIRLKRYFYMLRPVLACQWLEERGTMVPMEFGILLNAFLPSGPIRAIIDDLLARKRAGSECGEGPPIPALTDFIQTRVERIGELVKDTEFTTSWEPLDDFFRRVLSTTDPAFQTLSSAGGP